MRTRRSLGRTRQPGSPGQPLIEKISLSLHSPVCFRAEIELHPPESKADTSYMHRILKKSHLSIENRGDKCFEKHDVILSGALRREESRRCAAETLRCTGQLTPASLRVTHAFHCTLTILFIMNILETIMNVMVIRNREQTMDRSLRLSVFAACRITR